VTDIIDRAAEYEALHRAAGLQVHEERRRREQALQQAIHTGPTRDTCVECGDVIPIMRLQILPLATRCTPCQARQEQH
jgi:phage/conjugal plasmid C-4 type zinc finger TraR family protein